MLTKTTRTIIFIIVLALLPLVLSEPPSLTRMFCQLCILICVIRGFGSLLVGMTCPTVMHFASITSSKIPFPFFLSSTKVPSPVTFHGIPTVIAFASTVTTPLRPVNSTVSFWTLGQHIVFFLSTSIRIALPLRFRPGSSRYCNHSTRHELGEAPTVAKAEDPRSPDTNTATSARRPLNDYCDSDSARATTSITDTLACTDETDAASSSQGSAESSLGDPDSSPNSTWDDSDTTSATLLSDSDICSIAARFNDALIKKRFCVEYSIFRTPESGYQYPLVDSGETSDSNSSCTSDDTFLRLGDLLSTSFSATSITAQSSALPRRSLAASPGCSSFDLSPLPTRATPLLDSVFSNSFIAVATATTGSRSAPVSRCSSFSSNAPFFRPLSLFASSTSSDVSLAATSPSPSRPHSTYRPLMLLPAGDRCFGPSSSSLFDIFFDAPEAVVDLPSSSSQPAPNACFSRFTPSAHSVADAPTAALIPASLSAWYLAEGRSIKDDSMSGSLRVFGIPVEDLAGHSSSVASCDSDFSSKDEAYLRAALGLYEPASVPRQGFWTVPGGPRRWHPSHGEWRGWVFPGRGEHKPTFEPEEIPAQTPYDEDELEYLRARWGFSPTHI